MSPKKPRRILRYFTKNLMIIVGIVLIWRGIWYLLDILDEKFFGGTRAITAAGSIIFGLLLLYVPDKNLKEIEKL